MSRLAWPRSHVLSLDLVVSYATGNGDNTIIGSRNSINEAFAFDFDRF